MSLISIGRCQFKTIENRTKTGAVHKIQCRNCNDRSIEKEYEYGYGGKKPEPGNPNGMRECT